MKLVLVGLDGPGAGARPSGAGRKPLWRRRAGRGRSRRPSRSTSDARRTRQGPAGFPAPSSRRRSSRGELAHRPRGRRTPSAVQSCATDGIPRLLRDARRAAHRQPGRHQEGLPQARAQAPSRTSTRATPAPSSASRRSTRPTRSCPTRRSASLRPARARLGGIPARRRGAGRGCRGGSVCRASAASAAEAPRAGGVRFEFHGNPEDLAGFCDFFRTFFGGGGRRRGRPARRSRRSGANATRRRHAGDGLDSRICSAAWGRRVRVDTTSRAATVGPRLRVRAPRIEATRGDARRGRATAPSDSRYRRPPARGRYPARRRTTDSGSASRKGPEGSDATS